MAFEPQITQIETKHNRKLETLKTQSSVTLNANGEKILKVLSTRALPCVTNITVNAGTVVLEGNVFATGLVLTESGVNSITGQSTFSATYNSQLISAESQVIADVQNVGTENVSLSDLTVSFIEQLAVEISVLENQKISYVSSMAPANEKIETLAYTNLMGAKNEKFDLTTEIDLPNSVSKVLLAESYGAIKDVSASTDLVVLGGEIYTNLVYLTNDETPKLKSQLYVSDFHQEVLFTKVTSENMVFANLSTCSNDFEIQGELTSSKGVVVLKNKFSANIFVYSEGSVEAVVDSFCPRKEMQMNFNSFVNQKVLLSKLVTDKIDGNIVLGDDEIRIDKVVLSSAGDVYVRKAQVLDNDIIISGDAFVNVVYLLDDEERTTEAVVVEIPFETTVRVDDVVSSDTVSAKVVIKETEARNKKSKEIDVLAEIAINVCVLRNSDEAILSNIVIGENRIPPESSMGIYTIEKADDCWDIAKALLVSPEMLLRQNPDLTFPITKPTQIMIYRQQQIK